MTSDNLQSGLADVSDEQDEGDNSHAKVWLNRSDGQFLSESPSIDVKSEWDSVTVYLPDSLRSELELAYSELSYECKQSHGRDLQKLRDFYPLVVAMGLESLESADSEDILSMLNFLLEDQE